MVTLFESRYTLKGRYSIGNVDKTASMSMVTLFESRYTLNNQPVEVSAYFIVLLTMNVSIDSDMELLKEYSFLNSTGLFISLNL